MQKYAILTMALVMISISSMSFYAYAKGQSYVDKQVPSVSQNETSQQDDCQ